MLFFVLSLYANDWVAMKGSGEMMYVFALAAVVVCVAAVPTYIYGKRLRVYWNEHNLFKKFNMETKDAPQMG